MIMDFIDLKNAPDLVYRTAPHMDSLVFAPLEVALRIDQTHEALGASTWCEFTYLMPIDDLNEMLLERNNPEEDWLQEDLFAIPGPAAAVDLEQLCPQYFDGDYPQRLQKQQEYWVPKDILERWGRKDTTMLNGDFWMLETQYEAEILVQLKNKGLEVVKRDDLFFY